MNDRHITRTDTVVLRLRGGLFALLCLISIAFCGSEGSWAAEPGETQRRTLIIYSYDDLLPWQASVQAGLQERINQFGADARPAIYEERIDGARIHAADAEVDFVAYLQAKYARVHFDAVIAESAAATQFLMAHPQLFASAKRYAVNPVEIESVSISQSGIQVLPAPGDWVTPSFLALLKIMPDVTRIIAVVDHSVVGDANKRSLLAARPALPDRVALEIWDDLTFDDLFARASHLPPGAAIFYLPVFQDRDGARQTPRAVVQRLASVANAPIFAQHDTFLGTGIVGGRLLSSRREGNMMADLAASADAVETWSRSDTLLNPYIYDAVALERWQIPTDRLPVSSIVIEKARPIWYHYRWEIGAIVAALAAEGCLIVWLITALRQRKAAIGAVMIERDALERQVTRRTSELLAGTRGLEATNAQLETLASTDALTNIANRRKFLDVAEAALDRAKREGKLLSVLMLDIDRFKTINDRHGHAVGDVVIRAMAQTCKNQIRPVDCVGRLGGEEFAILLPGVAADDSRFIAERIRDVTSRLRIETPDGESVRFTVSIGTSMLQGSHDTLGALTGRADAALYRAKAEGRDRVVDALDPPPLIAATDQDDRYCA